MLGVVDDLHALAAAAVRGLDRDRPSDLLAERDHVVDAARSPRACRARPRRRRGRRPCRAEILSPITSMASGGGPIQATPRSRDRAGEVGVLGVEAVARVHAVDAGPLDDVEDRVGVQVALGRGLAAERVRLVGVADVQRVTVELGVHRDRGDPELSTGAHHADGDLAAVGDQDLLEHGLPRIGRSRNAVSYGPCRMPLAIPPEGPSAFVVRWFAELDSTNRYLVDEARAGAPAGTVVVADHQTRRARAASGARGSRRRARRCSASVLLRPDARAGASATSWWRPPRLAMAEAVEADDRGRRRAEVAERPPRARAQAVR